MTGRVSRGEVRGALEGARLDVAEASEDPRLAGVPLERADVDGDGAIEGREEIDRVFALIDRHDRDGGRRSVRTHTRRGAVTGAGAMLGAIGEHAGATELAAAGRPTEAPRPNDRVLFVGMNRGSVYEAHALRQAGARVSRLASGGSDDTVRVGRRRFDLSTDHGVRDFARTLGLPPAQTEAVARAIASNPPEGRDELASIARVWARAERGHPVPSRLVLSGHSGGTALWGEGGEIRVAALARLAEAMPRGARSVEDLHVAACNAGHEDDAARWTRIFPRLRTFWGYAGSAPGSFTGAAPHLRAWERETRGRDADLRPEAAAGTRKGENVATWNAEDGYASGRSR